MNRPIFRSGASSLSIAALFSAETAKICRAVKSRAYKNLWSKLQADQFGFR